MRFELRRRCGGVSSVRAQRCPGPGPGVLRECISSCMRCSSSLLVCCCCRSLCLVDGAWETLGHCAGSRGVRNSWLQPRSRHDKTTTPHRAGASMASNNSSSAAGAATTGPSSSYSYSYPKQAAAPSSSDDAKAKSFFGTLKSKLKGEEKKKNPIKEREVRRGTGGRQGRGDTVPRALAASHLLTGCRSGCWCVCRVCACAGGRPAHS